MEIIALVGSPVQSLLLEEGWALSLLRSLPLKIIEVLSESKDGENSVRLQDVAASIVDSHILITVVLGVIKREV